MILTRIYLLLLLLLSLGLSSQTTLVVMQPDAGSGKDANIKLKDSGDNFGTVNYGSETETKSERALSTVWYKTRSLFQFDVAGQAAISINVFKDMSMRGSEMDYLSKGRESDDVQTGWVLEVGGNKINYSYTDLSEFSIISMAEGGTSFMDGHSWLKLTNGNGDAMTFSIYGNQGKKEFIINKERDDNDYKEEAIRSTYLNSREIGKLFKYISQPEIQNYTLWNNCATFSSFTWFHMTNEYISPYEFLIPTGILAPTPRKLKTSIEEWNINKP